MTIFALAMKVTLRTKQVFSTITIGGSTLYNSGNSKRKIQILSVSTYVDKMCVLDEKTLKFTWVQTCPKSNMNT